MAGTLSRRRGRAVAMGVAAEPCALALPGPGWEPRRAPVVRLLLSWRSVGAGGGASPCVVPWLSPVSAFWVWACVVEEIWGLVRVGGLGAIPVRVPAWSHGKLVAGVPGAATVGYAREETEEGETEFGVEQKKSEGV